MKNYIYRFYSLDFLPKEPKLLEDETVIIYFLSGGGHIFINNNRENIEPNFIYYLSSGTKYSIEFHSNSPTDYFIISFKASEMLNDFDTPKVPFIIKIPVNSKPNVLIYMGRLIEYFASNQTVEKETLKQILKEIKATTNKDRLIHGARHFNMPRNTVRHSHTNEYQIDYFQAGKGKFLYNDVWKEISSGDFFFIPPNISHEIIYENVQPFDCYAMKFIITSDNFPLNLKSPFKINIPEDQRPKLNDILKKMLSEFILENDLPSSQISELFEFVDHIKSKAGNQTLTNSVVIEKTKEIINLNYPQKLTLIWLAKQIGVSPRFLSGLFKKETDINLSSYINIVRLEKSLEILKNSSKTIKTISNECGFLNPQYYIRAFKKHYNDSPAKKRKSLLNEG